MTEDHQIVGESHGEPLPAGRVGVRVQLQLSGCPSGRWSNTLSANLYTEFLGHPAVGHLRLDEIVQGDQIVLDGVEASEAPTLAGTLRRAVDATTRRAHKTSRQLPMLRKRTLTPSRAKWSSGLSRRDGARGRRATSATATAGLALVDSVISVNPDLHQTPGPDQGVYETALRSVWG